MKMKTPERILMARRCAQSLMAGWTGILVLCALVNTKRKGNMQKAKQVVQMKAQAAGKPATKLAGKAAAKPAAKKKMFRYSAPPECRVFVAGTFNGWSTDEHMLMHNAKSGFFQTAIPLAAGRYEYKFVIDGTWVADPACPDWVPNVHGSLNSVIVV